MQRQTKLAILLLLVELAFFPLNAKEISVKSADALKSALSSVSPGDVIKMEPGTYKGKFVITKSGTQSKPITLKGTESSVLIAESSYGLYLNGANYWILDGFSVKDSSKGIMLDESNFNILNDVKVSNIGSEGVHFRKFSCDNVIKNSKIKETGVDEAGFGEGVYIGSAKSNWKDITGSDSKPDQSNRNRVINNTFGPNIRAEHIDIKEGTQDGIIEENTFDGKGLSNENSADSWMDVKGYNYIIRKNKGKNALASGFEVHYVKNSVETSGCGNVFQDNTCSNIGTKTCVFISGSREIGPCKKKNQESNNKIV